MSTTTIKHQLLNLLIADCPPSLAACESDCCNTQCSGDHFERCEVRLGEQRALTQDVTDLLSSACERGIRSE
jgi:hypothetical protein